MEASAYSARQRRAANLVWTACGDYDFQPPFLALRADGSPDRYMNLVIGLTRKWLGEEMPRRLFSAWEGDARQEELDQLRAALEEIYPTRPANRAAEEAAKRQAAEAQNAPAEEAPVQEHPAEDAADAPEENAQPADAPKDFRENQ